MRNASRAFGFLTRNPTRARLYHIVFWTPSESSIKGIRVRYTGFLNLRSISKGTVDMN